MVFDQISSKILPYALSSTCVWKCAVRRVTFMSFSVPFCFKRVCFPGSTIMSTLLHFSITCILWSSKPNWGLGFSLLSIKIMATANEPWNTKNQNGLKSTNHDQQTWPFDPAEVSFCFPRGLLRWLTAAKNVNRGLRVEFQSSHDIENCNNVSCYMQFKQDWRMQLPFNLQFLVRTLLEVNCFSFFSSVLGCKHTRLQKRVPPCCKWEIMLFAQQKSLQLSDWPVTWNKSNCKL